MIGYLKGTISHIFSNACFIDVGGVGYKAIASATTLKDLVIGQETMLYTYMSVSEMILRCTGSVHKTNMTCSSSSLQSTASALRLPSTP